MNITILIAKNMFQNETASSETLFCKRLRSRAGLTAMVDKKSNFNLFLRQSIIVNKKLYDPQFLGVDVWKIYISYYS